MLESIRQRPCRVKHKSPWVMSSCLCKQLEGAVFPLWIHPVKDREYDAIHALEVDKANHRSSAAPNLHETALDDVGGAQFSPQMSRELEERHSSGRSLS